MKSVQFAESAFKHGFSEEDFYEMIAGRYLKLRSQRGITDIYELLGRNMSGDYLHSIHRVLNRDVIRVFHIALMTLKHKRRYKELIRR